jgi:hypothetical protein
MRYYFHAEDGRPFHDEEGTELHDESDAQLEAARVLGELIKEDPMSVWHDAAFRITVTDSDDRRLFALEVVSSVGPR